MYAWIAKNHGGESIAYCCKVLGVSRTGYHRHIARNPRPDKDAAVLSELKQIHQQHPVYGTNKKIWLLSAENKRSYGKIYKLCAQNGLLGKHKRKPRNLTKADPAEQPSTDLIQRDFSAVEPGKKWLGDITQEACKDGTLYMAGVFDCFDGVIVGLSMSNHMPAELCRDALESAVKRYGNKDGCIFHSDHGSQYTSRLYRQALEKYGFQQSMGRTGSCYDNARMESFWATLKKELLYELPLSSMTRDEVRKAVFHWIECEYHHERPYTANPKDMPPMQYRRWYQERHKEVA